MKDPRLLSIPWMSPTQVSFVLDWRLEVTGAAEHGRAGLETERRGASAEVSFQPTSRVCSTRPRDSPWPTRVPVPAG
ncbi:hypothetical protein GN956_G203 [Arapaima gigas]